MEDSKHDHSVIFNEIENTKGKTPDKRPSHLMMNDGKNVGILTEPGHDVVNTELKIMPESVPLLLVPVKGIH